MRWQLGGADNVVNPPVARAGNDGLRVPRGDHADARLPVASYVLQEFHFFWINVTLEKEHK
jgi:hypothetical protein